MKIEIFTLCDFAQDIGGKLTIVGTFDTIYSDKLPVITPTCSIVARIQFSGTGQHSFQVSLLDDCGNKEIIPPISGDITVQIPSDGKWAYANILIMIGQLRLPSYGEYSVNLEIDKNQVDSLTFYGKQTPVKPRA